MAEDRKEGKQVYLDIITSIMRRKKIGQQPLPLEDNSVEKLHETMKTVVNNLDNSIRECKKYNQAKIHRKYEIIIEDLHSRILYLQQKIKEEHRARSPSKKYVEDLLEKLINYKFDNQAQKKQIQQLMAENQEIKARIKIYEEEDSREAGTAQQKQKQKSEEKIEISGAVLKSQVTTFVKLKQNLRRHQKQDKTSFERFLKKSQDKLQNWSMRQFLSAIEKWTLEYYENDLIKHQNTLRPKQKQDISNRTVKATSNSFRLRNRKSATSNSNFKNNLSLYENILR